MVNITLKVLQSVEPQSKPYFIRDTKVKGFAIKVNPSGSIKIIAEVVIQRQNLTLFSVKPPTDLDI